MTLHRADDDSIAQYVAGTLPAAQLDEFEQHLLTCAECRDAVRVAAAARVALRSSGGVATDSFTARHGRMAFLGGLVATAAAVVAVWVGGRDSPLDRLGEIKPAQFVAGALRPSTDSITVLVDSGMAAYASSDFNRAADRLSRAIRSDSSAAVAFFLGVSLMLRGDDSAAMKVLQRVEAGSPYADEATYYLAKALVRLEQPDSAIALLERHSTGHASILLQSFADSLRRR